MSEVRAGDIQDKDPSKCREKAPPSKVTSELLDDSDDSEWEDHGDIDGDTGGDVSMSQGLGSTVPAAAVYVQGSSDVQMGPRSVYQAPVTINQHVHVTKDQPLSPHNLKQEALKSQVAAEVHTNGFMHYEYAAPTVVATAASAKEKTLCRTMPLFWGLLGAAALLSMAAVITVYLQPGDSRDKVDVNPSLPKNLPTIPPLDDPFNPNTTLPNGRRIFSKEQWGGYDAKYTRRLNHPTKYVVISHTVSKQCFESKTCSFYVRNIQDLFHSQSQYSDIGYSFLVGGDGNVYEGRGWDATTMHGSFVQDKNIAIAFIGNFVINSPTYVQIESAAQLIELGVELGRLDTDYKVVAHNVTSNTLSPGSNLYRIISQWRHFYVPSAEDPVEA